MRVCFDGLCFASRRTAAVDEETQTVSEVDDTGGGGHTNHICDESHHSTNNIDPTASKDTIDSSHKIHKHHCSASSTARNKLLSLLSLNNIDRKIFFRRTKMDSHDTQTPRVQSANSNQFDLDLVNRNHTSNMVSVVPMQFYQFSQPARHTKFKYFISFPQTNNNNNDLTKMDTTPTTITNTSTTSAHPLIVDTNSNEMAHGDGAFPCSPTNLRLNERIGDLCVSGTDCQTMEHTNLANRFSQTAFTVNGANLLSSEEHLLQVIQIKSARVIELEHLLRCKENEIAELKSHLDKFQSVFTFSSGGRGGRKSGLQANGQRQRAQGISAEPQSESTVLELLHVTFPKYEKDER